MILTIAKIGLSLEVDDKLLNELVEEGKSYYPNEFGGFLIGYYSNDNRHLYITDSVLPKYFKASRYFFERSSRGIEKILENYYEETPKKLYIGEWHTHPDSSAIPSSVDISAMNVIANDQGFYIANPVLLIIGYSKTQISFGFYVWFADKLYKYE